MPLFHGAVSTCDAFRKAPLVRIELHESTAFRQQQCDGCIQRTGEQRVGKTMVFQLLRLLRLIAEPCCVSDPATTMCRNGRIMQRAVLGRHGITRVSVVALLCCTLVRGECLARQSVETVPSHTLQVVLDGAVNPDSISDDVADRHFILAMILASEPEWEWTMARLRWSTSDVLSFSTHIQAARKQLDSLATQLAAEKGPTLRADQLRREKVGVLDAMRQRISQELSPSGLSILREYVRTEVKKRIVVYGSLPHQ